MFSAPETFKSSLETSKQTKKAQWERIRSPWRHPGSDTFSWRNGSDVTDAIPCTRGSVQFLCVFFHATLSFTNKQCALYVGWNSDIWMHLIREGQMSSFGHWTCGEQPDPTQHCEVGAKKLPDWRGQFESAVRRENLCLMFIQHWLIKVTFAHRLSKRRRPMGLVHVCVCVCRGGRGR